MHRAPYFAGSGATKSYDVPENKRPSPELVWVTTGKLVRADTELFCDNLPVAPMPVQAGRENPEFSKYFSISGLAEKILHILGQG